MNRAAADLPDLVDEFPALPAGEMPGPDDLPPDEPSGPPTATTPPFEDPL